MDLKNALAVCLISLFSASLVLLIARVLDVQAASRLEPQLARIVEELEAIRTQGGLVSSSPMAMASEASRDSLVVYYFFGNTRCPTCEAIESQAYQTVHGEFAGQLQLGELVWRTMNYEQPAGRRLQTLFDIHMPVVVLARMRAGQVESWKRLDRVWGLVKDETAFREFLRGEIQAMLGPATADATTASEATVDIPLPGGDSSDSTDATTDIPIPD